LQLGFAVPLSFIAVLAPVIKRRAEIIAAFSAGATALLLHDMAWNLWLICAAIVGILSGWAFSTFEKTPLMGNSK
jgi:predicted branched-subunit amino acid permease